MMDNNEENRNLTPEEKERVRRRNSRRGFFYCVRPVLIMFAIMYLAVFALIAYGYFSGAISPSAGKTAEEITAEVYTYLMAESWKSDLLGYAAALVLGLFLFFRNDWKNFDCTRENRLRFSSVICAIMLGAGMYLAVDIILTILSGLLDMSALIDQHNQAMVTLDIGSLWLEMLLFGLMAPMVEELYFRGMCFNRMREMMPEAISVVISASFFGSMHAGSVLQMIYATVLGIFLGWIYCKTENILAPFMVHSTFNMMNYVTLPESAEPFLKSTPGLLIYYFVGMGLLIGGVTLLRGMEKPPLKPSGYGKEQ